MKLFWQTLRMFLWLTLLTGLIYPLLITAYAQIFMKDKAEGQIITKNNKIIGSTLIAQKFQQEQYFWPRPSANNYDALASGGSNLGPTSKDLKDIIEKRQAEMAKAHDVKVSEVPSELVFASGSGLDPHISLDTALFQAARIAKARHIEKNVLVDFVKENVVVSQLAIPAPPIVNVFQINLALDTKFPEKTTN